MTDEVINIFDFKKPEDAEVTNETLLTDGKVAFDERLTAGAKGFISIVFDEKDVPCTIIAGEIEPLVTIGALEFCKDSIKYQTLFSMAGEDGFEIPE